MKEPIEVLEWIRNHWTNLKQTNRLEIAIGKYLEMSGDGDSLSIQGMVDIEENANLNGQYLK